MESEKKSNIILDFRKAIASIALLELSRKFDDMEEGQVLEICVQDKDTFADICKVLPKSSYEMNMVVEEDSVKRIKIKKKEDNR